MIKRFLAGLLCVLLLIGLNNVSVGTSYAFGIITSKSESSKMPTVIIDAGHGGFDVGAVAKDGTVEKDINLAISLKLNTVLEALGYKTVTVRTTDTAVNDTDNNGGSAKASDIKNRVALMNKHPDAIFVSIHMNKYGTTQPHGAQVFYARTENSDILANCIQCSISLKVQPDNKRVIKPTTNDIYLLKHATIPAVIVECGFLSNPKDLENLKNEEYQLKVATSIAFGIINYYKNEV